MAMAALQPTVGGPSKPPDPPPTFAEALKTGGTAHGQIASHTMHTRQSPQLGMHKGEIAAFFPDSLIQSYSQPFRYALVGKFSQGRPTMEIIHKFLISQDLKDQFTTGLLDARHIIINLCGESDFIRLYTRGLWYISGKAMRVFKWTPQFHVDRESSVVPIWFKLPKLPIQFFNKDALFTIASLFGQPLRLDSATTNFKRPSVARLQIEVDLLKPVPNRVWIGMGDSNGFWQKIEADEALPSYCPYCWHVGHSEGVCHVKNPELKAIEKGKASGPRMVYKAKEVQALPTVILAADVVTPPSNVPSSSGLQQQEKDRIPTDVEHCPAMASQQQDVIVPEVIQAAATDIDNSSNVVSASTDKTPSDELLPVQQEPADKTPANFPQVDNSQTPHIEDAPSSLNQTSQDTANILQDAWHNLLAVTTIDSLDLRCPGPIDAKLPKSTRPQPTHSLSETKRQVDETPRQELLQEFHDFSTGIAARIPPLQQPDDDAVERKRRPRRNYFDIPRTVLTRSSTAHLNSVNDDQPHDMEY